MEAAELAGPATRPVQLFYALSQGGRAIAAASRRLPAEITAADANDPAESRQETINWRLKGHGITAPGTSVRQVGNVTVRAAATGLMPGVALAIGAASLCPEEKLKLNDLWHLLPEALSVPLSTATGVPALAIESANKWSLEHDNCYIVTLSGGLSSIYAECGDDKEKIALFLDRYPTLKGYGFPNADDTTVWVPTDKPGKPLLNVYWGSPSEKYKDLLQATRQLKGTRYREEHDCWVFPSVGQMTDALHPLIAWWAILFGLSMMARYEPANWYAMTQIDSSPDANAIEHVLDQALDVIPSILLEGVRLASV
ncbi:YaaC family protein [Micromonospora lupini]